MDDQPLSDIDRARYEWQIWVDDFGEEGQRKLKNASVLVSRCGGVGSVVAYELAAAGVGRLVLAHAGNVRPDDLNRQLLMSHDGIGKPRVDQAAEKLKAFNPYLDIVTVGENISDANVDELVGQVDAVASCAPLFAERLAMNRAAVQLGKPIVDCAMFDLEGQVTTVLPGRSPCLACLYPDEPPTWKREFPVFGAVSGTIACIGAMEVIKVLAGFGETLAGHLLMCDLRQMTFRKGVVKRAANCRVCSPLAD